MVKTMKIILTIGNMTPDPDVITEYVQLNMSDMNREMRTKVNLIYGVVYFVLSSCGRCPPRRSSIGQNIYVHVHCLRAPFRVSDGLKWILNRYMVESCSETLHGDKWKLMG